MSIKCQTRVWDHSEHNGSQLLLLLAIADYAHDDGTEAYPSIETLAIKIRMSARQVKRLLKQLEESGELLIDQGQGRGNTSQYTVNVWPPLHEEMPTEEKVTSEVKGDIAVSPNGQTEKVTFSAQKVTSGAEKVTSGVIKGDIAVSPDPLGSIRDPMIQGEDARAREARPSLEAEPMPAPTAKKRGVVTSGNIDPRKIGPNGLIYRDQGATAYEVYREFFTLTPSEYQIRTMMGEATDLNRWREVLCKWSLAGFRSNSFDHMLDVYHNGWRNDGKPNGSNGRSRPRSAAGDGAGPWRATGGNAVTLEEHERRKRAQEDHWRRSQAAAAAG